MILIVQTLTSLVCLSSMNESCERNKYRLQANRDNNCFKKRRSTLAIALLCVRLLPCDTVENGQVAYVCKCALFPRSGKYPYVTNICHNANHCHSNTFLTTGRYTRPAQRERPLHVPASSDCTNYPVGSIRVGETVFFLFGQSPGCGQRSVSWTYCKRLEHSGEPLQCL